MSDRIDEAAWSEITSRGETMQTETILVSGFGGEPVEAYRATPSNGESRGGVVVIHHAPGYDRGSKEITRRIAELGYDAICPNLYWREAPGADPSAAADLVRGQGGVPDAQVLGDIEGAVAYLRELATSNQRVGIIGHCSGGRHAVLAATALPVDAAVDCYGGTVTGAPPAGRNITNLVDKLPDLRCPLLGLFGNDDSNPAPERVDELEQLLVALEKPYEFYRYDNAGHAFFANDRQQYRVDAANDGWERIETFYSTHLEPQ